MSIHHVCVLEGSLGQLLPFVQTEEASSWNIHSLTGNYNEFDVSILKRVAVLALTLIGPTSIFECLGQSSTLDLFYPNINWFYIWEIMYLQSTSPYEVPLTIEGNCGWLLQWIEEYNIRIRIFWLWGCRVSLYIALSFLYSILVQQIYHVGFCSLQLSEFWLGEAWYPLEWSTRWCNGHHCSHSKSSKSWKGAGREAEEIHWQVTIRFSYRWLFVVLFYLLTLVFHPLIGKCSRYQYKLQSDQKLLLGRRESFISYFLNIFLKF